MTELESKVRENRLRRMAQRQGLRLQKSPRRDPRATDYGKYALVDARTGAALACNDDTIYVLDIDDVEHTLTK